MFKYFLKTLWYYTHALGLHSANIAWFIVIRGHASWWLTAMSVELCGTKESYGSSGGAFIFKTQTGDTNCMTWQTVSAVHINHLYRHYGGSRAFKLCVSDPDHLLFLIFLSYAFPPLNKRICLTCKARFRLLTNTVSNLMSLRYCPTASPCCRPVSDRTVSTPCPARQTGWFNAHVDQSPIGARSRNCEFYLVDAFLCCTVFPHWVNIDMSFN